MSSTTPPPRKALVLAAGLGQRLRPLTLFQPKPLINFNAQPLIESTLQQLETWGVSEFGVNLHWQAAQLRDYLNNRPGNSRFTLSEEPLLRGTAGALYAFRDFIAGEPFWLVNADIAWQLDPETLLTPWRNHAPLAVVWLIPDKGPRTVETAPDSRITTYRSSRSGTDTTATFSGLQLVSPRIYDHLPPDSNQPLSLITLYEAAARAGEQVLGITTPPPSHWEDAGKLSDYLKLEADNRTERGKAATVGPFIISTDNTLRLPALRWPDPLLAPLLHRLHWPLHETVVEPLPPRGSDRTFLRLVRGNESAIYIRYGHERSENFHYAAQARLLLDVGLAVPGVLAEDSAARALILADGGRQSLYDLETGQHEATDHLYRQALDQVARLHTTATTALLHSGIALQPPFDQRLYDWERDFFLKQIVTGRHNATDAITPALLAEYTTIAARLVAIHQPVVIHRDLQSTNILINQGRVTLIDFQGMRLGAAAYDLAALLCDPYVSLAADRRDKLLHYYATLVAAPLAEETINLFPLAAVQRLSQALGAYGRLTALGLREWQRHILPAATILAEMATLAGLPQIAALAHRIIRQEAVVVVKR